MAPKEQYSRADIRRQFGLTERQLRSWERQDLIRQSDAYTFHDLIAIQTLIKLREKRFNARQIGRALTSLREKLTWVKQPLSELKIFSDGKRILVHVSGQKMESTGQMILDFEASEVGGITAFPAKRSSPTRMRESEGWFQKGLELEEVGAPVEDAIAAYRRALDLNAEAAGALVNLGTIYYRQRKFIEAEKHYLDAITADPDYPLAQFNLGNLFDEQGRLADAMNHYRRALQLNPQYADAHFNVALLYERMGDPLRAVHHWKIYLKLDSAGQWADIARRQLDRLRQTLIR